MRSYKKVLGSIILSMSIIQMNAQTSIAPMVKASWSQKSPFNDDCPKTSSGSASAAGCGAIAVAQILNYYKLPAHGYGHVKYNDVDVDFESNTIDWKNVLDSYKIGSSSVQNKAVSNLVYLVGAAMKMQYGTSSSPANYPSMMWGLQHYLHFSPESRYRHRRNYSTAEWIEMLNNELENGHPVFYRGDQSYPDRSLIGHMFVIDGRNTSNMYHANFGHANSSQDKYADLNLINQGSGTYPGDYGVCYHHRQAMVTDFFPETGLTDEDYDRTALVLDSAMVLNNDPHAEQVKATTSIRAGFQFRYVNFTGGSLQYSLGFYRNGNLVATSKTIVYTSLSDGGYRIRTNRFFTLPDNLANGDYEMCLISRDTESDKWIRGWDNAINCIPVKVSNGTFTFYPPVNYTFGSRLYLEKDITEIEGGNQGGKTFEFTINNPTERNFEDSLRISITKGGQTVHSYQLTSVYGGQSITYRYYISHEKINMGGSYKVDAYYKDKEKGWVKLMDYASHIQQIPANTYEGLEVYTMEGILVKRVNTNELENNYTQILSQLPKGVYIIRDKHQTRKFIKRR